MTIIVATREFIAADSLLGSTDAGDSTLTVVKVMRRRGGGLFATCGDSRRTHHFEKAVCGGREPAPLDLLEDEDFAAVLLMPDKGLVYFDTNFAPFPFGEDWLAIGCAQQLARSWMKHGEAQNLRDRAVTAIARSIEEDKRCGFPILVSRLDGASELIFEDGQVQKIPRCRGPK